jgi:hypothetical protein
VKKKSLKVANDFSRSRKKVKRDETRVVHDGAKKLKKRNVVNAFEELFLQRLKVQLSHL